MNRVYLTLGAVIRDQEHYVREWLAFHEIQGFERFVIVLHQCRDHTESEIRRLPFQDKIRIHRVVNDRQHVQMSVYRWIVENYGDATEWLALLDSDEFLFGTKKDDFRCILADYEEHDGLFAHWLEYGHNNIERRPEGPSIEAFTTRAPDDAWINRSGKSIIRPAGLTRPLAPSDISARLDHSMLSPHFFRTRWPTVHEDGTPLDLRHYWYTERHSHEIVRCNHYRYRSKEDWVARLIRGNGNDAGGAYESDWREFYEKGGHAFEDLAACRFSERLKERLGDEL